MGKKKAIQVTSCYFGSNTGVFFKNYHSLPTFKNWQVSHRSPDSLLLLQNWKIWQCWLTFSRGSKGSSWGAGGALLVLMGHWSSGLLLSLPCPLGSRPRRLWALESENLFGTSGLGCSMREPSWDFDTSGIFKERVAVFH